MRCGTKACVDSKHALEWRGCRARPTKSAFVDQVLFGARTVVLDQRRGVRRSKVRRPSDRIKGQSNVSSCLVLMLSSLLPGLSRIRGGWVVVGTVVRAGWPEVVRRHGPQLAKRLPGSLFGPPDRVVDDRIDPSRMQVRKHASGRQ
jgi:hypothetical protein